MIQHPSFDISCSIKETIELKASLRECWNIITTENHLELFHPFIISHAGKQLTSVGDKDNIIYINNLNFTREVISISEPIFVDDSENCGYDLLVGRKKKSLVKWHVKNNHIGGVDLSITIFPHTVSNYNKIIKFFIFNFYIKPQLSKYLKSVTKGLKYYIETKQTVEKDQFGKHKWFSQKN